MPQITQEIPNCAAKILVKLDLNSIVNIINCDRLYRSKDSEVKRDEEKKHL